MLSGPRLYTRMPSLLKPLLLPFPAETTYWGTCVPSSEGRCRLVRRHPWESEFERLLDLFEKCLLSRQEAVWAQQLPDLLLVLFSEMRPTAPQRLCIVQPRLPPPPPTAAPRLSESTGKKVSFTLNDDQLCWGRGLGGGCWRH